MNVTDILFYGNQTLLASLNGLRDQDYDTRGVCGVWSVKNILAHLAIFELWHAEVFNSFLTSDPTPLMEAYSKSWESYNIAEVDRRAAWTSGQVLDEYRSAHLRAMELIPQLPQNKFQQNGLIPWYGDDYCLNDLLVYTSYGHKREHSAQIMVFKDTLTNED